MTPRSLPLPLCLGVVCMVGVACATAGRGRAAPCELAASDAVFARGSAVFRDCSVDRPARFLSNGGMRPDFSPSPMRSGCYSADLTFVVDSTGHPEIQTARVARTTDTRFAEAELQTLGAWKYEPAIRDGRPVRQIVTAHQALVTAVVAVPRGSPPPSTSPSNLPRC